MTAATASAGQRARVFLFSGDVFGFFTGRSHISICLFSSMNTRLIIKNVPKHIKDSDFKAHFSKFGAITDAKIMRRPDGHSRQFGFIG